MNQNVPDFVSSILVSGEANFYVTGEVNRQNVRYWSNTNPHWMLDSIIQGVVKIMVWCGIWDRRIFGPFFIQGNLNTKDYLDMLKNGIFMSILDEKGISLHSSSKTGHHRTTALRCSDGWTNSFLGIGLVDVVTRSPALTAINFYFWGHLKLTMYQKKIWNMDHLKRRITAACKQIMGATLTHVCQNWLERLSLCLDMEGGHVENIL